jgi:hypothetical protein
MDQSALAVASGVSVETIKRPEGMDRPAIEFIDENGGGAGVRLKKSSVTVTGLAQTGQ